MEKCRPYLAVFPKGGLPKLVTNVKEYTTDLEPELHLMAKAFAEFESGSIQPKLCPRKCGDGWCTKTCDELTWARRNEEIPLGHVEKPLKPLIMKLRRGEDPDTIVMVEFREFACSGAVLGAQSIFFSKLRGHPVVDLRRSPMSANTFELVYKWLVQKDFTFKPGDVMRVVRAASFLEMKYLLNYCYTILENDLFREFWAFNNLIKSRNFIELVQVNQSMAIRISKAALIMLVSQEFLTLNENQICALCDSSSLAINSESELLYGVLHWLNVDWPARRSSVLKVLKNMRFAYLSPKILCQFNGASTGLFSNVLNEFASHPESKRIIEDGVFHSTLVITLNGDPNKLKDFPNTRRELLMPRRWIKDARCPYHRPVTRLCPNMRYISYEEFADYSVTLTETGADYEQYFEYPENEELSETSSNVSLVSKGSINDLTPSTLSVWSTDSLFYWVRSECSQNFQMDDREITSISSGRGVSTSSSATSQADVVVEHLEERIKKFEVPDIWEEWSDIFNDEEATDIKELDMLG
ncbi:hypothetical protein AWZ03_002476 [Drosophila navojoa]|uniref:BACK domain-containing protein n=1 Tax=Drosophila navojoa TaxID=7232 RepID=A0A484BQV2_DRONA|nr:uncharacterized protein LOC108652846 [Drosophila navojoa]TDG51113.1 hypothetical protein AWZ03_002476 [Drosophila navojoa]